MSKSENEGATIYLKDDDATIRKKIMKAKTDAGPTEPNSSMPESIQNLFQLLHLVSDAGAVQQFRDHFNNATIRYGDLKKLLAEDMVRFVAPIREKADALYNDEPYLKRVLEEGAEKARVSAAKTIEATRDLIGFRYFK